MTCDFTTCIFAATCFSRSNEGESHHVEDILNYCEKTPYIQLVSPKLTQRGTEGGGIQRNNGRLVTKSSVASDPIFERLSIS